jgi:hypothetical protein
MAVRRNQQLVQKAVAAAQRLGLWVLVFRVAMVEQIQVLAAVAAVAAQADCLQLLVL